MRYSNGSFIGDYSDVRVFSDELIKAHKLNANVVQEIAKSASVINFIMELTGLLAESSWGTSYKFARELLVIPSQVKLYEGRSKDSRSVYDLVPLVQCRNVRKVYASDSNKLIEHLKMGTQGQQLCAAILEDVHALYLEAMMAKV